MGLGIDGAARSLCLDATGTAGFDFINTQVVSLGGTTNCDYIETATASTAKCTLFSSDYWGQPGYSVNLKGGNITLQLAAFFQHGTSGFGNITAGTLNIDNSAIYPASKLINSGGESKLSVQSSIIDSIAGTSYWKNNLTNPWIYAGTIVPVPIPGKIEAENYNSGGQNVAYYDTDPQNNGGQYRPYDAVDIDGCSEGGYDVGGIQAGEWLKYNVIVTKAAIYTIQARVASPNSGKAFHLELDGVNISGSIAVPNTGGWQNWQTVTYTTPNLTLGQKVLRLVEDTDGFNVNYINFVVLNEAPAVTITSPVANAVYSAPASVSIAANATDTDGTVSKVEFYNGTTLLNTDSNAPYTYTWTNVAIGTYTISVIATDNSGNKTTATRTFEVKIVTSSAEDALVNHNISLYPNPAENTLTFTGEEGKTSTFKLLDVYGKELLHLGNIESGHQIDLSGIASGIYFVYVDDYFFKIVKK